MGKLRIAAQRVMAAAARQIVSQLGERRKLDRAHEARHRDGAARVGEPRAHLVGCVPEIAEQEPGEERITRAQHVVDLDVEPWRDQRVLEPLRDAVGEHHAAARAALQHDDSTRRRADAAHGLERVLVAGGDVYLLLGADDQVAARKYISERGGHGRGARVASVARVVTSEAPEVGAVVDVEHHLAPERARDVDGPALRPGTCGEREVRAGHQRRARRADQLRIDVALIECAVGAVLP